VSFQSPAVVATSRDEASD